MDDGWEAKAELHPSSIRPADTPNTEQHQTAIFPLDGTLKCLNHRLFVRSETVSSQLKLIFVAITTVCGGNGSHCIGTIMV